jgi:hypothetical protein
MGGMGSRVQQYIQNIKKNFYRTFLTLRPIPPTPPTFFITTNISFFPINPPLINTTHIYHISNISFLNPKGKLYRIYREFRGEGEGVGV